MNKGMAPIKHNSNTREGQRIADRKDESLDGAQAIFRQQMIDEAVAGSAGEAGLKQGDKAKDLLQSSDGSA